MHLPPEPSLPPDEPLARRLRWGRWLWLALWSSLITAAYGIYSGALQIPSHINPWAPLEVTAPPNMLTSYKLSRARSNPARCLAALASTGMQYDELPDRSTGDGCGFSNAVRLRTAPVRIGAALPLSCPMALSFFMWERNALQPAAHLHFGQRVAGIDHLGSYACRNINSGGEGALPNAPARARSRHATANALDISAFTLASGKRITVLKHWPDEDDTAPPGQEALLLRDAHKGACKYFKGVLGPAYNAAHRDHFHLETGGYSMCK
ncbi:extensin family protein [Polaromonas aquatica]|uniref:extensin-like domain-containing protein n=1 Tax=Polaromonas aquatica TaxID=332657 RepID=UPI003D645C9E